MANWLLHQLIIDGTKEEIREILPEIKWEMKKKCIKKKPYTLLYDTTYEVLETLLFTSKRYPNVTFYLTSVDDFHYSYTCQNFAWIMFELLGPTTVFKNGEILASFEQPETEFVAYQKYLKEKENEVQVTSEIENEDLTFYVNKSNSFALGYPKIIKKLYKLLIRKFVV